MLDDMETSVEITIERIKLQEQQKEVKLREKREFDILVMSLHRAIRDGQTQIEKGKQEMEEQKNTVNKLNSQLIVEQARRDALVELVSHFRKELDSLRKKSDDGVSSVWILRSTLLESIHDVTEKCDIWSMLVKPAYKEVIYTNVVGVTENTAINEDKLNKALERRDRVIAERDRLISEPDRGDEYIRKYISTYRTRRFYSTNVEVRENEPIKFSTSPAAKKSLTPVIRNVDVNMPWYQPYSVVTSVAIFLIYFCMLREESDVDQEFNKTLYDRIKGLEKEQLLQSYRYNIEHGNSVEDIERRLKELEAEEKKQVIE